MERVINQAQTLNQILNMVDSDTNVSTDFKSVKLTDSVVQRDMSNFQRVENQILPAVADLGSQGGSVTQETHTVAAPASPVKQKMVIQVSPLPLQINTFDINKSTSSKAFRLENFKEPLNKDSVILPTDPVITLNSITAVYKKIKRKSDPYLQSYHFPANQKQHEEDFTVTLPVISALFKSMRPLTKELEVSKILESESSSELNFESSNLVDQKNLKSSQQPFEPIIMLPAYTAFFKYNRRELNRELIVIMPEHQAIVASEESGLLNQFAPVSDASKTLNFTLTKTGTNVSDSKPEEHFSTLSSQPNQFQALNKFTNQVGPILEMKEETDSRSPSPSNNIYSEKFKTMLNQPFEKESIVSEDPPNSMMTSGQRLGSFRAPQVDSKDGGGANSKSSRENRKNSSDMKNNSMNERQESSEQSSSKIEAKSELESINKNLNKLQRLMEEPEVKLTESDSTKLDELGLRKPRATKLADLNGMKNDQEIQQWVMENLEGSSSLGLGFKQYQEGSSMENVKGSGKGSIEEEDESEESASSQDKLVYKIICLPTISAFTKEVKRNATATEEFDYEQKGINNQVANNEMNTADFTEECQDIVVKEKQTKQQDEVTYSVPAIGATRKIIALQRYHQEVRTTQELSQGIQETESSLSGKQDELVVTTARSIQIKSQTEIVITLPLITAMKKRLKREAYGDQIREDIVSQQDIDAVYDLASYSMSEDFSMRTQESVEISDSSNLDQENMKLKGLLDSQDVASIEDFSNDSRTQGEDFLINETTIIDTKQKGAQNQIDVTVSSRNDLMAQAPLDTPNLGEQRSQFPSSNSQFIPMHEDSESELIDGLNSLQMHQRPHGPNIFPDALIISPENDGLTAQSIAVDQMEFEQNAEQELNAHIDITLSSADSLMNEMMSLHKQIIEQTCRDHQVVLEMKLLSRADLDQIQIPQLVNVIECFKNDQDVGKLANTEMNLIYKNLKAVGIPTKQSEAEIKVGAKKQTRVSVINQDFYTRSDGGNSARSEGAAELLVAVQTKPPVAPQQRQSAAPQRNNAQVPGALPVQPTQAPPAPGKQTTGQHLATLGQARNAPQDGLAPSNQKEVDEAARAEGKMEAPGLRVRQEEANVVPVKIKKQPAGAGGRTVPVGQSHGALSPGDQLVVPIVGNVALPEPPSKSLKGKVQPVAVPKQPEVLDKEASPLIKKSAVQPNNVGLESPHQAKEQKTDLQKPAAHDAQSLGESVDLSREEAEKDAAATERAKEAAPIKEGEKCACQSKDPLMMPGMMGEGEKKEGEEEEEDEEEQQLSYKALIKFIEQYHPVHPLTKERFDFGQRVTVKDYALKLWDPCFMYVLVRQCKKVCAKYYKLSRGNVDDHKGARPDSLKDLPDSPSDSSELEDEVGFGGLTAAGAHLGVGAILYLQTMKTFALLFLILTILNLPVYFIYSQTTVGNDYADLTSAFQYYTFGNFGATNKACSSTRLTFDADTPQGPLTLRCGLAHHYMVEVQSFGLLYKWDPRSQAETDGTQMCETISGKNMANEPVGDETEGQRRLERVRASNRYESTHNRSNGPPRGMEEVFGQDIEDDEPGAEAEDHHKEDLERISQNITQWNLDTLCQSNSEYLYADKEAKAAINDYFRENCFRKEACRVDLDDIGGRRFRDLLSPFCRRRVLGDPEAATEALREAPVLATSQLLYVVGCQGSTYQIRGYSLHKQQLACFVVVCDLIGAYFMLYVFNKLRRLNEEYIAIIDDNQITMKDFSVQCQDVLLDKYTQDIRLLRMKVWLHFTRQFAEYRLEGNAYEVVDVALSLCNKPETLQIFKMEQTQHEINVIKSKLGAGEFKDAQFFQKKEELEDLSDMYERQKERYKAIVEAENKARRSVGILPKCHRLEFIDYIFVTFKNVECVDKVVEVFEKEPTVSRVLRCIFCVQNKKQTDKEFLGAELSVECAVEPDEILWESLQQETAAGGGRAVLLQVMAVLFLVFSGAIQVVLEGLRFMVEAADAPLLCPEDKAEPITPEAAYADVRRLKPRGLMPCYCRQQLAAKPWAAPFINFVELEEEDDTAYCLPWFKRSLGAWAIKVVSAVSILALNGVISRLFKRLVQFQMKHTKIETTKRAFVQIMTLEFLNTGIIMCLVSLTGMNKAFVAYEAFVIRPEELGYAGFDSDWYFDVGRVITVTVFLSCFWANFADCRVYFQQFMVQFKDRRRGHNLKKFPNDEDDDQPNTRMHIQDDLERLYEGQNFDCEATLSRMMSIMYTLVVFSSGMPVLYGLGCLFFTTTYLANKLLFFKFYKRTDSILSREIPTTSVYLMRYAVVLKMLAGLYMLNNPSILETRDAPSEWTASTKGQIPRAFDVYGQLAGEGRFAGSEALNGAAGAGTEGGPQPGSGSALDYAVYFHQQLNIVAVLGSFLIYILARFSVAFGRLLYKSTVGAFIALCLKIWYMLKFCAAYILALLQKFYRWLRLRYRKSRAAARKRARRASAVLISQATGKEQNSQVEIEEEEERKLQAALAKDRKAEEKQRKEDGGADGPAGNSPRDSAGGSTIKSENSAGAANAIEEAARRMKQIAQKAYEAEVVKSRLERTDYSANLFNELNMVALDQVYERAGKEYQDFRAFFNINDATEKYLHNYQPRGGSSTKTGRIRKIREDFLELCYMSNIIEEDVKEYDGLLYRRINDIKEVIDAHFKLIQPAILAEAEEKRDRDIEKTFAKEDYRQKIDQRIIEHKFAKNPDLQFDNLNHYTYRRKLEQLKSHQDALIKADKEDINNRRNVQRACRLQGSIAQSYFIFDNPKFKVARKIYFGLAEEEQRQREQQEIDDINETSSDDFDSDEEGEEELEETESDFTKSEEQLLQGKSSQGEPRLGKKASRVPDKENAADLK